MQVRASCPRRVYLIKVESVVSTFLKSKVKILSSQKSKVKILSSQKSKVKSQKFIKLKVKSQKLLLCQLQRIPSI
ncbi:MAG: hypothetical protein F6K54_07080 [Okeania sp. SIO3B5]|uniref:hypothetical protein n=1 Tax=Okeania sp. SIO3B5 TaxID=2607811 RepID=UPI0014008967|nr:hypothetical protein [Okeania sp. SIO3B5]NEO52865.1 hypothetical protein [Okeania sp. SIO3B5]